MAEITRAQELDPLSLIINSNVGEVLYYMRRYDPAIEQFNKVLELDPTFAAIRCTIRCSHSPELYLKPYGETS